VRTGIVYTETVVYAAPERFAADAPYQVVIVDLSEGGRVTARVRGDRVAIGDKVSEAENQSENDGGIPFFQKL